MGAKKEKNHKTFYKQYISVYLNSFQYFKKKIFVTVPCPPRWSKIRQGTVVFRQPFDRYLHKCPWPTRLHLLRSTQILHKCGIRNGPKSNIRESVSLSEHKFEILKSRPIINYYSYIFAYAYKNHIPYDAVIKRSIRSFHLTAATVHTVHATNLVDR